MNCEILTIGSELLLGQIVDTNASYLAQTLNSVGVSIIRHSTVGDTFEHITDAMEAALKRAEVVITTGGIGPTEDDLTRQAAAEVLGVDLEFRQDLMDHIEKLITGSGYQMSPTNRRQAFIPRGSEVVHNPVGTAPGFIGEKNGSIIISLPGVPRELKYLMKTTIIPYLRDHFDLGEGVIHYRVLNATGLGESSLDRQIGDLIRDNKNPEIGLLASPGHIRIRLTARAENLRAAEALIEPVETEIRSRLGDLIFAEGETTLQEVVESLLIQAGLRLGVVETFTGGRAGYLLSGSGSRQFAQGRLIADSDELNRWLNLDNNTGAEQMAEAAAQKITRELGAETGLSFIGRLEPGPRGFKVFCAFSAAGPWGVKTISHDIGGDMRSLSERGTIIGLNHLRKTLIAWRNNTEG